jgi:hypothetical protein
MKPSHRRHPEKANAPKDIADQFRELQKLRIKVSKAELAAAQKRAVDGKTPVKGNDQSKPINRSRTR